MRSNVFILCIAMILVSGILAGSHTIHAQDEVDAALDGPIDSSEIEAFADAFFEETMAERNIPGAAFVVVRGGEILFSKGYGFADIEAQTPVSPEETIFKAGSVSKLVTWTALMQVYEQGLLELDTDINEYLPGFQIPDTFSEPITAVHLATHTAGFEDQWINTGTNSASDILPLGDFIAGHIPDRVRSPGEVHSYNNYGTALGGYLVEVVSGMSFEQYTEENIFDPLGMTRTSFRQPLPDDLAAQLAPGYFFVDETYEASEPIYLHTGPEGVISTTANDMAAFMIAHLNDGQYEDVQVLQPETAQLMHTQQFTHDSNLPGMAFGFKERVINGYRVIGHGGDIHAYSSQMILLPDQDVGFFVVYNLLDDAFREQLISEFFDRYYPPESDAAEIETISMSQEDLSRFAGGYRWVKHPSSTMGKVLALLPGPYAVVITANDNNTLSLGFFGVDAEWIYAPVAPMVFRQISGGPQELGGLLIDPGDTLAFRENTDGQITYAFVPLQNLAMARLAWYETPVAQLGTLGTLLLVYLSAVIVWPLTALFNQIKKRGSEISLGSKRAKWLVVIVSGLNLVFLVGILLTFGIGLITGVSILVRSLLVIPVITAILTVGLVAATIFAWMRGYWGIIGRIYYSVLAIASIIFLLFLAYWNLLGWQF